MQTPVAADAPFEATQRPDTSQTRTELARLRRLCLSRGAESLGDAQLLQLVSRKALELDATPRSIALALPFELEQTLGADAAAALLASVELGRRALRAPEEHPQLLTPQDAYRYLRPRLAALPHEVFHVLCLNGRNRLLRDARVAQGTVDACPVDPREVFAAALSCRASGILLAHNHPSGDPTPSQPDIALTRQLQAGADALCVRLVDHLVLGDDAFVSMKEKRLM